jgi:hypothetical protein
MFRRTSNILCALSLLLALTLVIYGTLHADAVWGVWVKRTNIVQFAGEEVSTPHIYYLNVNGTDLIFGHWRNPQVIEESKQIHNGYLALAQEMQDMRVRMAQMQQGMTDSHKALMSETLTDLDKRIKDMKSERRVRSWSEPDGFHVEFHDGIYSTPFLSVPSFGGIKYDSLPSWTPPAIAFRCFLPIWYILPLLLIAPAWRGFSIWRHYRRRRANVCRKCGYDLRGSPQLCPECGTVPT